MAKPFSIQSPEDIAKDYGGNKQKIAEAMQMGIVDPTAGVLAGMFIDRMRAAQMQEMAPQQTVAQQVMGGAPAAPAPAQVPPPPQPSAPAGLGAIAPQGGEPMPAPQEVPVGMAMGGIVDLPVPDSMYDEPTNGGYDDGYAGGGLVAFAGGGDVEPGAIGALIEEHAIDFIPAAMVTSRQRSAAKNRAVGGDPRSFHLTGDARDFVPPKGMSLTQLGDTLKKRLGPGYDVIYNTKGHFDHVHVEPSSRQGMAALLAAGKKNAPAPAENAAQAMAEAPREDISGVYDQLAALQQLRAEDIAAAKKDRRQAQAISLAQRGLEMMMPKGIPEGMFAGGGEVRGYASAGLVGALGTPKAADENILTQYNLDPASLMAQQQGLGALMPQQSKYSDLMLQDVERRRGEDYLKSERKQAANNALMNFGLALMATKNPNFFGAVGESGAPAVAALQSDIKEIKKDARQALVEGAQIEGMKNEASRELAKMTLDRANVVAQLKAGNLDRASRERLEKEKMDLDWRITQFTQSQENYRLGVRVAADRAAARDAAASPKDPYDFGSRKIVIGKDKRGKPIERELNTRVNKQTGAVEYYSDEAGTYLSPEYTSALAGRPNAITGLQNWAKQYKARIDVVDGKLIASDASGRRQLVDTNFLKGL